jgi:hypothetical protein
MSNTRKHETVTRAKDLKPGDVWLDTEGDEVHVQEVSDEGGHLVLVRVTGTPDEPERWWVDVNMPRDATVEVEAK